MIDTNDSICTPDMTARIKAELARIEKKETITILYACESGSRAWGFASVDSDYDVRFIYLRPTAWYFRIQEKRDVVELPITGELDISGWDLPKTLALFRKSNPPLLEWLQSPMVYRQQSSLMDRLYGLMGTYYSPTACMHHYLRMAEKNFRKFLQDEDINLKKYFYALRPTLACLWIQQNRGPVPIEFEKLVNGVVTDAKLEQEIHSLLRAKRRGMELERGPKNPVISAYLEGVIPRLRAEIQTLPQSSDPALLNQLFLDILKEVNGGTIA